jgi:outer membrane protein assembly factor BamB
MLFNKIQKNYLFIVAGSAVFLYLLVTLFWLFYNPVNNLVEYVPGMDKIGAGKDSVMIENIKIGEKFETFSTVTSELKGLWPGFRGTDRNNIFKTNISINEDWNTKPPKILWSVELGEGHAAPAIYEGIVYLLDYDEKLRADALRSFSLTDGKEIWRRSYNVYLQRNHGMSRTIPAVTDKYILTIGPRCHTMCLDRLTGNLLWGIDIEKDYGTEIPFWYTGQCPLIDKDTAIIAPVGKILMMGVDCKTGKILWETPNPLKWKMSHSSVMKMVICSKKMYVYSAVGGICGVSAEGNDTGKMLWKFTDWNASVIAPSPLFIGDDKILCTAGYGAGCAVIKIENKNNEFTASLVQKLTPAQGIASEQQTPIFYNGFVFSILPKDAGTLRNQFACFSPADVSKTIWTSGKTGRYGLGPYMVLNDKFLILNDEGDLSMLKASTDMFKLITQKKIFDGSDAWGPMAFADGYLLLRDSKKMYCLDLK